MKKIIFVLALSVVMLFAGCGNQTQTVENSVPEPPVTETETTVPETETTAETTAKVTETTVQTTAKATETAVAVSETAENVMQSVIEEDGSETTEEPTAPLISAEEPAISETPTPIIIEEGSEEWQRMQQNYQEAISEDPGYVASQEEQYEDWQIRGCDPQLHELGIDVVISGTTEEREQIYHDALVELFGSDVNVAGTGVAPTDTRLLFELSDLSAEEREQMYQDFLAGRDWHDISDAELVANLAIISQSGHSDIIDYLTGKYNRQFSDTTYEVL
ncbi:MAG: hypothetical protein IJ644_02135 [Oscillospiraceae bacterium]|nr:hypothetical protein [Oscillospiraceae bacterium]